MTATYNIHADYDYNYEHGPTFHGKLPEHLPASPRDIWGLTLNSPLGVPAGPLLNAAYVDLYARLGFDVPVYKTVRSRHHPAHPAPNCLFVEHSRQLAITDEGQTIYTCDNQNQIPEHISITNSFGMPSRDPEIWQADIERANRSLSRGQLMIVSCVGTPDQQSTIEQDYARCARLAAEAGARAVELNFSCPNVSGCEGSIYQDAALCGRIVRAVKHAIPHIPVMIKIGIIADPLQLDRLLQATAHYIDGIAAINTLAMQVRQRNGEQALPGTGRLQSGICGALIQDIGLTMTQNLYAARKRGNYDFIICGVGGIAGITDINAYLQAGADLAMSATGAMWNPYLARDWKTAGYSD